MTQEQKIIRAKVGLLELARQLGNVSQACKMMGYSRDSFYRFKELYDAGGELALQELTRRKPILKNRTPPEVEAIIVELSLDRPAYQPVDEVPVFQFRVRSVARMTIAASSPLTVAIRPKASAASDWRTKMRADTASAASLGVP